ncbi:hypothetical protein, partial [Nocardia abscessus]|uniref:hypothetical protein n=1 Tax=Nocardia abscessus TaxID=120957 RepID=UPI003CC7C5F9
MSATARERRAGGGGGGPAAAARGGGCEGFGALDRAGGGTGHRAASCLARVAGTARSRRVNRTRTGSG